jgi:hypothetical protein
MAPCRLCRVGGSKSPRRNLGVDSSRWRFHPWNLKICQCHIVLQTNVETLVRCCSSLQYTSHNACTQARQHISTTMKSKASGLKHLKKSFGADTTRKFVEYQVYQGTEQQPSSQHQERFEQFTTWVLVAKEP